jgi:hypothetical protein
MWAVLTLTVYLCVVTSVLASVKYYIIKNMNIPPSPFPIRNFNILFTLRVVLMCHMFESGAVFCFFRGDIQFLSCSVWGMKPEKK